VLLRFYDRIKVISWMRNDWTGGIRNTLLELLVESRGRAATDDRDKVYALLGLTRQESIQDLVAPDYSVSTEQVFVKTAIAMISGKRSLSAVASQLESRRFRNLPSWVPDWTAHGEFPDLYRWHQLELYNASRGYLGGCTRMERPSRTRV